MANGKRAIFLPDSRPEIGAGHLVRCAVLADVLSSEGWECVIAANAAVRQNFARRMIEEASIELVEGEQDWTAASVRKRWPDGADLAVIDHYGLDAGFEAQLAGWAGKRVVIDDLLDRPHDCETLICFAPPEDSSVSVPGDTEFLAGPAYALIGPRYWPLRMQKLLQRSSRNEKPSVAVSFGGTSQDKFIQMTLRALAQQNVPLKVHVAGIDRGAPVLREFTPSQLEIVAEKSVDDMADILFATDFAIGGCGGSAWERAALAVPSAACVIADNQAHVAKILAENKAAIVVGGTTMAQDELTNAVSRLLAEKPDGDMSRRAAILADGLGARRVASHIEPERTKLGAQIVLRQATAKDCMLLFEWQQEPQTRMYSNNPKAPDWQEHQRWYETFLRDPLRIGTVVTENKSDVGALRIEIVERQGRAAGLISINLSKRATGRGIGAAALRSACRLVPDTALIAEIDPDNTASLAAFAAAGFHQTDPRWFRREPSPVKRAPRGHVETRRQH